MRYPSVGWTTTVLTWGVLVLCSGIVCWWCGIRVQAEPLLVQPALGYHITNSQSRYITQTRLKSAQYSLHNNAPSSRKLLKMDVLTSETCWAVNWHNKASVIKLVYFYSNIKMMHGPICIRFATKLKFVLKIVFSGSDEKWYGPHTWVGLHFPGPLRTFFTLYKTLFHNTSTLLYNITGI